MSIRDRIEDLYPAAAIERVLGALQAPELSDRMRDALRRVGLKDAKPAEQIQQIWRQAKTYLDAVAELLGQESSSSLTLNATGALFGPHVEGIAVSATVAHAMASAATHFHHPGWLLQQARSTALRIAQAYPSWHTDLNSLLTHAVRGRTVFVAKTDVQRLPGIGDLDAILAGLSVREVGASNGCAADDWSRAFSGATAESACLFMVTPNGLPEQQETAQCHTARQIARESGIEVIELAANACVTPALEKQIGLPLIASRAADSDGICIVPLHLFVGAPTGYVALGSEKRTTDLQEAAAAGGTALGTPGLAAVVTALQLGAEEGALETGLIARLAANPANLRNRAQRLAIQLLGSPVVEAATADVRHVPLGPPPWSRYALENWAVTLTTTDKAQELAQRLKKGKTLNRNASGGDGDTEQIGTRIAAGIEDDKLILDLRFIEPRDDHLLVRAFCNNLAPDSPTPV